MDISTKQILAFAMVARLGSFSRAANQLGLGQSAVTQHVAALEKAVGAKLLVRGRSGSQLTPVGRDLYDLADQLRVLKTRFLERATQYASVEMGTLSISVSTPRPAMAVIAAFQRRYPGVRISVKIAPWREAVAQLRDRTVDLAIVIQPDNLDGLHAVEVERQRFVAVLPRQHQLARRKAIGVSELAEETLIKLSSDSYTSAWVDKKFDASGDGPQKKITTASYEMMLEAVAHGLGVSIALEGACARHPGVSLVPVDEFNEKHPFVAVCGDDNISLRVMKSFFQVVTLGQREEGWHLEAEAVPV